MRSHFPAIKDLRECYNRTGLLPGALNAISSHYDKRAINAYTTKTVAQ